VNENYSAVRNSAYQKLRKYIRRKKKDDVQHDIDTVMEALIEQLMSAEDYTEGKDNGGGMKAYIDSHLMYTALRVVSDEHKIKKNLVFEGIDIETEEEFENSIFDTDIVSVSEKERRGINFGSIEQEAIASVRDEIESLKHIRNKSGIDVIQRIYIALKVESLGFEGDLEIIEQAITRRVDKVRIDDRYREHLVGLARAIASERADKVIEMIGEYVYCRESIDRIIEGVTS
jgi:hypothetical protein